ncbi:MSMEG_0567/Sll0786 family nitrogen starvation N-acetyltransferase [Kribbella sp. NPDC051952]|uniref:MSMEG_0567/Sll0786 family nitrogen starvation N-acetyltransferase n=1 Tax=Kribbella sp. NPDC051952 TaxID=3154851 RepID=UPI0034122DD5
MTDIGVWRAAGRDLAKHYAIRQRVFVLEQRIMEFTDLDPHDRDPETVHVLSAQGSNAAGTVRLYPLDGQLWQGDRLAVLPSHRSSMVGAELVRFAVATAKSLGGAQMLAQIQLPNVRFFERLGWTRAGAPGPYCGLDHQPMVYDVTQAADLDWPGRPEELVLEPLVEVQDLRAG